MTMLLIEKGAVVDDESVPIVREMLDMPDDAPPDELPRGVNAALHAHPTCRDSSGDMLSTIERGGARAWIEAREAKSAAAGLSSDLAAARARAAILRRARERDTR